MLLRLLILLTVVPLVELAILLRLADRFSWESTIALVLVTGAVGAWLARREGLKVLRRIQADMAAGVAPTDAVVDGALILVAGLVLITPGILTDLVGFALLIAPMRRWIRRRAAESFKRRVAVTVRGKEDLCPPGGGADRGEPAEFIDVTATVRDVDEPTKEPDRLNPSRGL